MVDQVTQTTVQPPPPLWGPEQPDNSFTADEGHVPLPKVLWKDAKEMATTGFGLLGNLKTRSMDFEQNIEQKFVGHLLSNSKTGIPGTAAAAFVEPPQKFLSRDEYEKSEFKRPGINFDNGVYENIANLDAEKYDNKQITDDLRARTDQGTWPSIAKGAAYVGGGIINPLFGLLGAPVKVAITPAAHFLTDLIPEIKGLSPWATSTLRGIGRVSIVGGAEMPVYSGLDYAEEKAFQEPASIKNILYSIPIGMAFATLGETFSKVVSSKIPKLDPKVAEEHGISEPAKGEEKPEEVAQPVSQESHEQMFQVGTAQMENGKIPEIGEVGKQNYHDDWQKKYGEQLRTDPEGYERSLDNLKTNKEVAQKQLRKVNKSIEKLERIDKSIKEKKFAKFKIIPEKEKELKIIPEKEKPFLKLIQEPLKEAEPEQISSLEKETAILKTHQKALNDKLDDIDNMIDVRENPPNPSNMEDVHASIDKMNQPQSDFSYFEPKEQPKIPDEEQSSDDFVNKVQKEFNARKATMAPEAKEFADTTDLEQKHKGIKTLIKGVQSCLGGTE